MRINMTRMHWGRFFNDKADSFSLCKEELTDYFDIGDSQDIDIIILTKETKNSYKVQLKGLYVEFLDIKSEDNAREKLLIQTVKHFKNNLPELMNKPFYVSVEI